MGQKPSTPPVVQVQAKPPETGKIQPRLSAARSASSGSGGRVEPISRMERPLAANVGSIVGFSTAIGSSARKTRDEIERAKVDMLFVDATIRQGNTTLALDRIHAARARLDTVSASLLNIETAGELLVSEVTRFDART